MKIKSSSFLNIARQRGFVRSILALTLAMLFGANSAIAEQGHSFPGKIPEGFNRKGNVLISDQFNNRVMEISPTGKIVWSFGLGPTGV
jgi:hypothetical protein